MRGCLLLGRYLGIRLLVHWSFMFILLWVGWLGWNEGGLVHCLWAQALILLLFFCVVLHEFGHSIVAMRFGVAVNTIILLPIGGVAVMSKLPRKPVQELLIAIAGPAVNVVIVLVLGLVTGRWLPDIAVNQFPTTIPGLMDRLMWINVALILFNLLPAFPMDGGRVLRSLLAMFLNHARATRIAAWIGQGMAILFVILGIQVGNPFLFLIALFVFISAAAEVRSVRVHEQFRGVRAQDVMHRAGTLVSPSDSLARCRQVLEEEEQRDFLVVDGERLVGVLDHQRWQSAIADEGAETLVGQVYRRMFVALDPDTPIGDAWRDVLQSDQRVYPVVEEGRILGKITQPDVLRFLALSGAVRAKVASPRVTGRGGRRIDLG